MTENNLQYKMNFHKEAKSQTNEYLKLAFIEKSFCVTCENLGPFSETLPGAYKFNNLPLHIIKKTNTAQKTSGPKAIGTFLIHYTFFLENSPIPQYHKGTSNIRYAFNNIGNFGCFKE